MLQDLTVNVSIIKHSKVIPCSRKIVLLRVYLDQLELVYFETDPIDTPHSQEERRAARRLYKQIEYCLQELILEEAQKREKEKNK